MNVISLMVYIVNYVSENVLQTCVQLMKNNKVNTQCFFSGLVDFFLYFS